MRIKLVSRAMRDLLNSSEMRSDLQSRANRIAAAAGEGFEADQAQTGRKRARVVVAPKTFEARKRESREGVLMRALDAGR